MSLPIQQAESGTHGAFFVERDGERVAEMTYSKTPDGKRLIIDHTDVSESLKGQGVGKQLVAAAVAWARRDGLAVMPLCPFAKATFDKTPEFQDVLWR
ncbi:MAG: GNAT family N-acetyltransferase [Myxococcaceae bacterium]|nr:GNAT family N-acetyltransferase [Myxococcaceae bacterium]